MKKLIRLFFVGISFVCVSVLILGLSTKAAYADSEVSGPTTRASVTMYELYGSVSKGKSTSSWITATSAKKSNAEGTLSFSKSLTSSNSYSGSLKVSKANLDATVGFNTSKSTTETASMSVKVKKNKSYTIYYRRVYNTKTVKQRKVTIDTLTGKRVTGTPTNITTKQYSHIEWKAVEK